MLTGTKQIASSDWGVISSSQLESLGSKSYTSDGREFRYGLAGATTLLIGNLTKASAVVANHQNVAVAAAAAAGSLTVTVTLGATAATANQYAGGYLGIYDSAGAGGTYLIVGNPAASSSGSLTVTLAEPITTALTTSSKVNLTVNPYGGLVITTSATDGAQGVPGIAVTAANYGWFQTRGIASVLSSATVAALGLSIIPSATPGAVNVEDGASTAAYRIGYAYNQATVSTKYSTVNLTIA